MGRDFIDVSRQDLLHNGVQYKQKYMSKYKYKYIYKYKHIYKYKYMYKYRDIFYLSRQIWYEGVL